MLPDPHLFLYTYVRREAVLSSQIEGTQSSLADLLLFELEEAPGTPLDAARYGSPDEIAQLRAPLDARRAVLCQHLFALGDRLYAEKPARLLDRLAAYWDVWHRTKKRHLPPARWSRWRSAHFSTLL